MKSNFPLQNCSNDDVLSFKSAICKVGKVRKALQEAFQFSVAKVLYDTLKSHGIEIDQGGRSFNSQFCRYNHRWFDEGVDCEILKIGADDWKKGKVKIKVTLEFCPDEPEGDATPAASSERENGQLEWTLDEISKLLNGNK